MAPTSNGRRIKALAGGYCIRQLGPGEVGLYRALNALFAEAFEDRASYADAPPSDDYLEGLLGKAHVIALAALDESGAAVGGLVAYQLDKFEQARSEIYIYDLAVRAAFRRRGIASGLIARLQQIAAARGAWAIFVQADYGDEAAIALYSKLGRREDVIHFDLDPRVAGEDV